MPTEKKKKEKDGTILWYVGILLHEYIYILEHHIIVSICSLVIFLVGMWTGVDRIVLGGKEISLQF